VLGETLEKSAASMEHHSCEYWKVGRFGNFEHVHDRRFEAHSWSRRHGCGEETVEGRGEELGLPNRSRSALPTYVAQLAMQALGYRSEAENISTFQLPTR
jgi:hypothetical protein